MSPAFRSTLLWLAASLLMYVAAMSSISAAYFHGQYFPDNEDAFYHARRILDSVLTHAPVIQFDPKIHAPEGSWLCWPWGFDTMMATITSWFGPYADMNQANRVLMNIPPALSVFAVLLVVRIGRQLSLSMVNTCVFTVAFVLLPTAFRAFSVGNVDHHFAELLTTLGVWSSGIWFFRAGNRSAAAAITLGAVLGGAVALQNGLFILQVPLSPDALIRGDVVRRDPARLHPLRALAARLLRVLHVVVVPRVRLGAGRGIRATAVPIPGDSPEHRGVRDVGDPRRGATRRSAAPRGLVRLRQPEHDRQHHRGEEPLRASHRGR
jgi:hypothetical protein